jgi:phosphoribosylamine--glycine ligase
LKVLVIGGGGREHALAWKLAQSPGVSRVYCAPGNPGIARVAECSSTGPNPDDYVHLAERAGADLTVVGPEAPLVAGIADAFRACGKRLFGPSAAAARLEASKLFAKGLIQRAGIPTARFEHAETETEALAALARFDYPVVLKADGLAAGKGVIVADDRAAAEYAIRGLLSGDLVGDAGRRIVIEEFLRGEEVSYIVLTDGRRVLPLAPTQDHKAVFNEDRGPNTGGMGAYCDTRILSEAESNQVLGAIIHPTIERMAAEGSPFTGFLYAGLMMTADGPRVLEFNVRLGDPEAQPLMHRLGSDLAPVLESAAAGSLDTSVLTWKEGPSVCVVLAAEGYPRKVRTGDRITGIDEAEASGAVVFHAGTRMRESGLETSSGRVLGVTASGSDLPRAIHNVYESVEKIRFEGMHYRTDIGRKGLKRWAPG